jgi:hypothetical protein
MTTQAIPEFMEKLAAELGKTREPTTVKQMIAVMRSLNGGQPFKNLQFLKNTDAVMGVINTRALSTRGTTFCFINNVLMSQPRTKKLRERYAELSRDTWDALGKQDKHAKSKRQEENMIPMQDVVKRRQELRDAVASFENNETLTRSEYDCLMSWFLVCLYTMVQPRRNQDYALMEVCQDLPADLTAGVNYLVLADHKFVFQQYKTRKHYGTQEQDIPDDLMEAIALYLKFRPTGKSERLIVSYSGEALSYTNGITRLLNRAFGKKIGATMLRHIYLSDKYANNILERQADAEAMGHSVETATGYIKI